MADKLLRVGPLALTNTLTTNVYAGAGGSALLQDEINHIHIANKTGGAVTFTLYLGATGANAAGTELWVAKSISANDSFDWYGRLKLLSTDFIVGGASAATSLTITMSGKQMVV